MISAAVVVVDNIAWVYMYINIGTQHQETTRKKTILETQPKKHYWLYMVTSAYSSLFTNHN